MAEPRPTPGPSPGWGRSLEAPPGSSHCLWSWPPPSPRRPSSPHHPLSGSPALPVPLGIFHLPKKVLMTVSPCEALINLRGRWLRGDQGLCPYADEDYGSISCGGEGTPQTFLPAIKATWLSSVALGKEKKRSPLRKEINCVLCVWQEIKTGHEEVENTWSFMPPLMATESGRTQQSGSQLQPWGEAWPQRGDGGHCGRASAPSGNRV